VGQIHYLPQVSEDLKKELSRKSFLKYASAATVRPDRERSQSCGVFTSATGKSSISLHKTNMYFPYFYLRIEPARLGVLDEPYSAKPAQRSSRTGPPGYIDGHGSSLCKLADLYATATPLNGVS
jgi:hypothetical protein